MTAISHVIRDETQMKLAINALANCPVSDSKPWIMELKEWEETRRAAQNRLSHMWYSEISKQGREYTPDQVKQRSKLHWGVPILLASDSDFAAYWEKVSPLFPNYEEKCEELMPRTPVPSIMGVKQMSLYISDMERSCCHKYRLTDPRLYGL